MLQKHPLAFLALKGPFVALGMGPWSDKIIFFTIYKLGPFSKNSGQNLPSFPFLRVPTLGPLGACPHPEKKILRSPMPLVNFRINIG